MIEKKDYLQWESPLLLSQLKEGIRALPKPKQAFYCGLLENAELTKNILFLQELFALVNYELVWSELVHINQYLITTDDLRQLLPWVTQVNQKSWDEIMTDYHAYYVFNTLKLYEDTLLSERQKVVQDWFVSNVESKNMLEKHMHVAVDMMRQSQRALSSTMQLYMTMTFAASLDSYCKGKINNDQYIAELIKILQNNRGCLSYPFYEDLVRERNIPYFQERLIPLLQMEYNMGIMNILIEPTFEDQKGFLILLDKEKREEFENRNLTPQELHRVLQAYLIQVREALITPFIIFQNDEKDLVLEFPKASWCKAFVYHLAGSDDFKPQYYQGKSHSLCFQSQKNNLEKVVIEFPTDAICTRFKRLIRDYPEHAIASVSDNNKAICLPDKTNISNNGFFKCPLSKEIMRTSLAEQADRERALCLLLLGFKDEKSLFANLPTELFGVIVSLMGYSTTSQPVGGVLSF